MRRRRDRQRERQNETNCAFRAKRAALARSPGQDAGDGPRNENSDRLQFAISEPNHFQEQPSVPKARDLGLAERTRLVVDRRLDNFEVLLRCAEDQIEIAERIEVAEIPAPPRPYLVILGL